MINIKKNMGSLRAPLRSTVRPCLCTGLEAVYAKMLEKS